MNQINPPTGNAEKTLRVLYLCSEAHPFVKIGGLGDVAGSLPPVLYHLTPEELDGWKIDIRLAIPYHPVIAQDYGFEAPSDVITLEPKSGALTIDVFETELEGMPVYLLDGDLITKAKSVYSFNPAEDVPKFSAFSFAALALVEKMGWKPDIVNANDWHTALAVYAVNRYRRRRNSFFRGTKTILSIHNLPYMGADCKATLKDYGMTPRFYFQLPKWARRFCMPLGIATADELIAVSPNYAKEIQTPEFGCTLENYLRQRADSVSGIINGLDLAAWNPETDEQILQRFSVETLEKREKNKQALIEKFELDPDPAIPLIIIVSRMDHQKGMDITVDALRQLKDEKWQAIILGSGQVDVEDEVRALEKEFPDRVRAVIRYDGKLAKELYAGGNMILLPSRYEPCGLTQLISMRYGCVPVAHETGGFKDTIIPEGTPGQTGFLYSGNTPENLAACTQKAFAAYQDAKRWRRIQQNGMSLDFSWKKSAITYAHHYITLKETQ